MNSTQIIDLFVLEHLSTAPLSKQIEVCKAMAELAATPEMRESWTAHADELTEIQNNAAQLWLSFRRKASR